MQRNEFFAYRLVEQFVMRVNVNLSLLQDLNVNADA